VTLILAVAVAVVIALVLVGNRPRTPPGGGWYTETHQ